MIPSFDDRGNLPPGIHLARWDEVVTRFGVTEHRRHLLNGLRSALLSLRAGGCARAYLDGSFVTTKEVPGDFDACWEVAGVDPDKIDGELLDFSDRRAGQKRRYGGELFPADAAAVPQGTMFIDFFQVDRLSGAAKGILAIDLESVA